MIDPNESNFEPRDSGSSEPTESARDPEATPVAASTSPGVTSSPANRDPLHGVTLELMVSRLAARHGWAEMGEQIPIRCFLFEPSVKSSLKFLRRTPWARKRVEDWYLYDARRFSLEEYDGLPPAD